MIGADLLLAAFALGIGSSAHCAGMCGVFAFQAAGVAGTARAPLRLGLYVAGKTFTYVFLGALVGAAGARVLGLAGGVQIAVGAAVGAVMIAAGIGLLRPVASASRLGRAWAAALRPFAQAVRGAHAAGGPFALGLATGFLPCGVAYLAALQAAAIGDPLGSAASMGAFGLGTAPVLVAAGLLGRGALERLGAARLRWAGGALVLATGAATLVRALMPLLIPGEGGAPACCH